MIETVMLVALGFSLASLVALLIAPAVWNRAARLTKREIEATMPISVADIKADKDLLRAEYAVELRRLELALEKAKQRAARHLMERNQHMVEMGKLESEVALLKSSVAERTKASSVMEQTVRQRIPELEAQLEEANRIIAAREQELAERARAFENQTESLEMAQSMIHRQEREIERLREALQDGNVVARLMPWRTELAREDENVDLIKENSKLQAELSRLREQLEQLKEVDAADSAELRAEMQRLADLMVGGAKAVGAKTGASKATAEDATDAKSAESDADTDAKESTDKISAKQKPARSAKTRKSLTERLSGLKRSKVKESA